MPCRHPGRHPAKPDSLPAEYRFQRGIPVQLDTASQSADSKVDGGIVLRNPALTPLTVAGDLILLPVWLRM